MYICTVNSIIMMKIANILKAFRSNFSSDESFEKVLTNKRILSLEKTLFSQKDFNSIESKKLFKGIENVKIKISEDAIKESLKSYYSKNKSFPLNTLFNPEYKDIDFDDFIINELGQARIELIECNNDSSTSQLLSDYYLHSLVISNEIERITTRYIIRLLRNSLTKVYKDIQSKFNQIPLKFKLFEFFDLIFSLKRDYNYHSALIRTFFIENLKVNNYDREIYSVISIIS